jgi:hypothetical protein
LEGDGTISLRYKICEPWTLKAIASEAMVKLHRRRLPRQREESVPDSASMLESTWKLFAVIKPSATFGAWYEGASQV